MTKELQDLAWSLLPKEFKEEVKGQYSLLCQFNNVANAPAKNELEYLFGRHNLTSDAKGEEMLTCEKSRVQQQYNRAVQLQDDSDSEWNLVGDQILRVLSGLFGSKCLPDEPANEDNFASKEPKPAEPKFKKGDMVKYRLDGKRYEIMGKTGKYHYALNGYDKDVLESDLEPYAEPSKEDSAAIRAESVKESRIASEETHLRNLSQEAANCDKHHIVDANKMIDNIIKDGFSKERRCNIAVQMVKALTQSSEIVDRISSGCDDGLLDGILHDALYLTDKLIAECEKGGEDGED